MSVGIGDELMMAGEARRRAAGSDARFAMLGKDGGPKWHFAWEHAAHVARPGEPAAGEVGYDHGTRPYIAGKTAERWTWREYRPTPAKLVLPARYDALRRFARGAIVFHPAIKAKASPNKDWGLASWKALVARGIGRRWLQLGEPGMPQVKAAEIVPTHDLWAAAALIAGAQAVVVHEGALHHLAAAFSVPAVVIRGGYISPRCTGYAGQRDLYVEDPRWPLGCGMRIACQHCQAAMGAITPERVLEALGEVLEETPTA